ncbi:hypothetical protein EJ05DRAFT_88148 [Pseudovirgaria hyperparasitica]|uniref:Uncharacterized protein n=1 Tax=Pseudovirgaria hyperparasitica TaxID=470096 RepID=A0A6A6W389_9PEZI|nr:uncharacterized protein EJ05DRAFT_88148 [Pseudovirgaria hyperparasitica]KAF2756057.1 hypothetical protein EJ05DRAFT_88148 [Pseudovirgaria hyperparasitica]
MMIPVRENHVAQMRRRRRERDAENAALFRSLQEASHTLDGIASMVELANSNHQHQPSTRTLGRSVGNTFPMSDVEDASSTRLKRRKLDHSHDEPAAFNGFSYGHFGQVVPGRLRMEIVSCDGGEYADADSRSVLYRPENILRNDRSVYCTKSSECNILLQHQGGTTFCVEQIVIRAPRKGFTAPVQEGLIFVGMSADELTEQSSRYEITQHESRHCDPWSPELTPDDEPISLLQSLQDPEVWEGSRQRQSERAQADFDRAERDQAWTRRRMEQMYVSRHDEPSQSLSRSEENCDWLLQDHTAHASDANPDDSYAIDPVTDDDSSDVDEESSTAVIADRMRRDARAQDDTDFDVDYTRQWRETRDRYGYARSIRRSEPRQIEPRADSGKTVTLPPSAKFFMEKNKITVKFPTPLSAKYILLKFYSSRPQGNIDVQSVVTYGFAGPRYFPACEMR